MKKLSNFLNCPKTKLFKENLKQLLKHPPHTHLPKVLLYNFQHNFLKIIFFLNIQLSPKCFQKYSL